MAFKIGFATETIPERKNEETLGETVVTPVKSVVDVYFPARGFSCTYYNEAFDLHKGDIVYVEGKLEGLRGRVVNVNYTFKIKLSDYKRVIHKVDTEVKGKFCMAGSHFVTFEKNALPYEKALLWFKAPEENEEYVSGNDNEAFLLEDLSGMKISKVTADKGHDYYMDNKVVYFEINDGHGRAIVVGGSPYEVEFYYKNGEINGLVCSCYCSDTCKHEFAVMLQLRETLDILKNQYKCEEPAYFAVIHKPILFEYAVDNTTKGSITLE